MFLILISDMSNIHTISYWFYVVYDIIMLHASSLLFINRTEYFIFALLFEMMFFSLHLYFINWSILRHIIIFFEFIQLSLSSSFSGKIIQIINIFISIVFRYFSIHHCYRIKTPLLSSPVVTVILSWLINCWILDLVPISRLQMRYFNNRLYWC